jgi:hypothetical protein
MQEYVIKSEQKQGSTNLLNQVEGYLQQLAKETDDVKKSEFFKDYLNTMSKFWKYSYHNQMLIHFQMPSASNIAGFKTWQSVDRRLIKGSKGIKILAPSFKKISISDKETNEKKDETITFFYPVTVFDISQTDGKSLPTIEISVTGDKYKEFLDKLVLFCKEKSINVEFKNLGINGLYGYSMGGKIAIDNKETINSQVNTLIHEIAHELLHKDSTLSKHQKEIQAEGIAYVVTSHFGIENRSYNYLALYDADYKKIMDNLKVIAEGGKEIIECLSNNSILCISR